MNTPMPRRDFLKAAPVAALALSQIAKGSSPPPDAPVTAKIEPFDYKGVRLLPSRWQKQYQEARNFYLSIPDDNILHGYRAATNLPAPGQALGGWCSRDSSIVFGQWLSGMARMHRATNDKEIRDKAITLFTEWAKTVPADGRTGMNHYAFDKLVCGLVDLKLYADFDDAIPMLERITTSASKTLNHANVPGGDGITTGRPAEWYTLSENQYRAYQLTGNPFYKEFGDVWRYTSYWGKFESTSAPPDAHATHAYSHVNTFSSAAMTYAITGDEKYLRTIKNAYDWLQNIQTYATGGFGPGETMAKPDGGLGRALYTRQDTFETNCGSWAGFKLHRYLMRFTGEARYGDWAERLLYNGIGAALPVKPDGNHFYYSDYKVAGGMKTHYLSQWACCSGTYIQTLADYHNIIYYKDAQSLYVSLYVPSEVTWNHAGSDVKLKLETSYPEAETSTLTLDLPQPQQFALKLRVPEWASGYAVKVNGAPVSQAFKAGDWATLDRSWKSGDKVEVTIPLSFAMKPVDKQHPDRVALQRGPVTYVMENDYHQPTFALPDTDAELAALLPPDSTPGWFRPKQANGRRFDSAFRPFYTIGEDYPYRIYFDKKEMPIAYW